MWNDLKYVSSPDESQYACVVKCDPGYFAMIRDVCFNQEIDTQLNYSNQSYFDHLILYLCDYIEKHSYFKRMTVFSLE